MRFCGGRTVASVMIIALAYLAVSLTESVLFIIFCGSDAFYQDALALIKNYDEAIYITAGALFFHLRTLPALLIGMQNFFFLLPKEKTKAFRSFLTHFPLSKSFSVPRFLRWLFA